MLAVTLLSACTAVPVTESGASSEAAYQHRAEVISGVSRWGLVGRISLDNGEEGGSGRLQWDVKADRSTINFHGAMGRGAWQLETDPQGAVLRLADGNEFFAPAVDELIQQQVGWSIPVAALQWWVRGLAAPGPVVERQLGAGGLLKRLKQFGWQVDFNRYGQESGVAMPTRMVARHNSNRVKLAISRWRIPGNHVAAN